MCLRFRLANALLLCAALSLPIAPKVLRAQAIPQSAQALPHTRLVGQSPALANPAAVSAEVAQIVSQMSLTDKLNFISGTGAYDVKALPQFNLPQIHETDGGVGIRLSTPVGTEYPAAVALSATWNTARAADFGTAIARDAQSGGFQDVLAPGMDFYRTPFGGRQAEYLSGEDPYLGAVMAPTVINAMQAQGVWATAKHFVLNEQETNRFNINDTVDNRALHELYLVPFESAVKSSQPANIMCAFNKAQGLYSCQNPALETTLVKQTWGFQGFIESDFNAIVDGVQAALAGTDLDMPAGAQMNPANLTGPVQNNTVPVALINDKVTRILTQEFLYGYNNGDTTSAGTTNASGSTGTATEVDNPANEAISTNIARESMVLLSNPSNVLPLSKSKSLKIAVVGVDAEYAPPAEYGSPYYVPTHYISELSGIISAAASGSTVDFIHALSLDPFYPSSTAGFTGQYYSNNTFSGTPAVTRVDPTIAFDWTMTTEPGFAPGTSSGYNGTTNNNLGSTVWTGTILPTVTGDHVFKVRADGAIQIIVNGDVIASNGNGLPPAYPIPNDTPIYAKVSLTAGIPATVQIRYARQPGWSGIGTLEGIQFSWAALTPPASIAGYDAVIVADGLGVEYEGEGFDHPFTLPEFQTELIANLAAANPHTIAVIHAGTAVDVTGFNTAVGALLYAWYPGQNGGQALADVLFGNVSPSGKLPFTFDAQATQNAAYPTFPMPLNNLQTPTDNYAEGLYLGYRAYEKNGQKPLYPFGYGLSYTSFQYTNPTITTGTLVCTPNLRQSTGPQAAIHATAPAIAGLLSCLFAPLVLFRKRRTLRSASLAALPILFVISFLSGCSNQTLNIGPPIYGNQILNVNFDLTNTGNTTGSEVAEVYVGEQNPAVSRPVKELKGFTKVTLTPGQTTHVSIPLNPRAFAYYDTASGSWLVDAGAFTISVGGASDNIALTQTIYHSALTLSDSSSQPTLITPTQLNQTCTVQ